MPEPDIDRATITSGCDESDPRRPVMLLGSLLPPSAVVEELRQHPVELDLYPGELAVVASAVDQRRREFAAVRRCARRALSALGHAPSPILPGRRGAPHWPPGVVGSMTHCAGFAAAALGRETDLAALGIDAEPHADLPDGLLEIVSLPKEASLLRRLRHDWPHIHWDRLLFCSKETVYKAWFPLTGAWLGFDEALIDLHPVDVDHLGAGPASGTFSAHLLVPGPVVDDVRLAGFTGQWAVGDGILATAIAVPRAAPARHLGCL